MLRAPRLRRGLAASSPLVGEILLDFLLYFFSLLKIFYLVFTRYLLNQIDLSLSLDERP